MNSSGWYRMDVKTTDELDKLTEDPWKLGYFHLANDRWDGTHWNRKLTEVQIRDLVLFTLGDIRGKRILDVGCAYAIYLDIIARMGGEAAGQDIDSAYVNAGLRMLREKGLDADIKIGDVTERLLFDDNYFDGVISADFFEHIDYEQKLKVVSEVYRVLKPGGIFTIKTPNLDYLRLTLFIRRIIATLKFKWPFTMHIAHTRNNPSSRHCGLTTYRGLEKMLFDNMFHQPEIIYYPLLRKNLPMPITKLLYGKKLFTEQIIITAKKPLFYGYYP